MTKGGQSIRRYDPAATGFIPTGAAGCLVRLDTLPDYVLMLTAGHVLLTEKTRQYDPVEAVAEPGEALGRILSWTDLDGDTTVDAALVWVDPDRVSPGILGQSGPRSVAAGDGCCNLDPREKDTLYIYSPVSGALVTTWIAVGGLRQTKTVRERTATNFHYRDLHNQIICRPPVTRPGDSGSIALDQSGRVVGMVVAGDDPDLARIDPSACTIITPIASILNHPSWRGGRLEILDRMPDHPSKPTMTLSGPKPQAVVASPAPGGDLGDGGRVAGW